MVGKQQRSRPRNLRPKKTQVRYNICYNYEEDKHKENAHNDDDSDNEEEAEGKRQRTPKKVLWPVTCGTEEGFLNITRLQRGELCIRYNGVWISPPDFEICGGRSSAKKWKNTIRHNNKPLEFFFKRGDLSTKRFFKLKKTPLAKDKVLALSLEDSEAHSSAEIKEDDAEENRCELDPIVITDDEDVMEDEREGEKIADVKESEGNKKDDEDLTAAVEQAEDQSALKEMHPNISAKFPQISAYPVVAIERLPLAGWDVSEPQVLSDEDADRDEQLEVTDDSRSEENVVEVTTVSMLSLEYVQENKEKLAQSGEMHDKQTNAKSAVDESNSKDLADCSTLPNHIVTTENMVQTEKSPNGEINGEIQKDLERSRVHRNTNTTSNVPQRQRLTEGNLEQITEPLSEHQCDHNTAKLQDGMPSSVRIHPARPHASTHAGVDQMDLDQLRREKLKKQLKVLQLQEEYYTFKLNKLKEKK